MGASDVPPAFGDLFSNLEADPAAEQSVDLLQADHVRIERIVSLGQATPPGVWLCESQAEWVVLLSGEASLRFESETVARTMHAGDWALIPAGCRHRVEWTRDDVASVWLAVHFAAAPAKSPGGA